MAQMLSAVTSQGKNIIRQINNRNYEHVSIQWDKIHPKLLLPKKEVVTKNDQKLLVTLDVFTEAYDTNVILWRSEREALDNLEKNEQYLCNILKTYINSRSCAVVLHNDSRHECGYMGLKPHVHVIVDTKLPGKDRLEEKSAICDADVFQIREKVLAQKGRLEVQKI